MADDNVVILNNLGNLTRRESKTGKVRYTVEVKSEPLIHDFDPKTLGGVVAVAIAAELRRQVKAITQTVSAATKKARERAAKSFASGAPSAQRAYSGGKMGPMAPNQSDKAFNDSGRLAESIVATARDEQWTVNIASNRFNPALISGGELGVARMWRQLVELVPAFKDTSKLFETEGVKKAIGQSMDVLITQAKETRDQLTEARARAVLGVVRQAFGFLRLLA